MFNEEALIYLSFYKLTSEDISLISSVSRVLFVNFKICMFVLFERLRCMHSLFAGITKNVGEDTYLYPRRFEEVSTKDNQPLSTRKLTLKRVSLGT